MMLRGNIPGRTQTIPMAIYFAVEGGNEELAYIWVALNHDNILPCDFYYELLAGVPTKIY